jgi:Transcription factor WhiB
MSSDGRNLMIRLGPWMDLAACRGMVTSADEDIFFAPERDELGGNRGTATRVAATRQREALAVCNRCAVQVECLAYASPLANSTASGARRPSTNFGAWWRTQIGQSDVPRLMLGCGVDLGLDHKVSARRDIHTRRPTPTGTAAGRCAGPASWPGSAPDG